MQLQDWGPLPASPTPVRSLEAAQEHGFGKLRPCCRRIQNYGQEPQKALESKSAMAEDSTNVMRKMKPVRTSVRAAPSPLSPVPCAGSAGQDPAPTSQQALSPGKGRAGRAEGRGCSRLLPRDHGSRAPRALLSLQLFAEFC